MTSAARDSTVDETTLLRRAAASRPDAPAFRDEHGCSVGYRELERMVAGFADALAAAGAREGAVVSLVLPNAVAFPAAFLAARGLGAVVNPIAPFYGPADIAGMLRRADPAVVIAAVEYRGRKLAQEVSGAGLGAAILAATLGPSPGLEPVRAPAGHVGRELPSPAGLLVFTSGSEGAPKGVIHSTASFGHASREACRMSALGAGDVFVTAAPLSHLTGMFAGFRSPLEVGGMALLLDRWDAGRALDAIERHGATFMHGPPTMLIDLVGAQRAAPRSIETLRLFRSGGAALAAAVVREAEEVLGLEVVRGYGSSETLMVTNGLPSDDAELRAGTDGAILDGVEVELRAGERGDELLVRGATRFMGYLPVEPDADVRAGLVDPAEWFPTGDLVELVGERHLRFVGRKKDIIVRGGLNISSVEVERALVLHPEIEDAAVVPVPDPRLGERCCAVIVAREARPTLESVREFLRERGLATFKAPERLRYVDRLPRTANGKIAKDRLRRMALDEVPDEKAGGA